MNDLANEDEKFLLKIENFDKWFFVICVLMILFVLVTGWTCFREISTNPDNLKFKDVELELFVVWVGFAVVFIQARYIERKLLRVIKRLRA
jgi:hypothetical protein